MCKVLITGATGFVGRHLIAALSDFFANIDVLTINRDVEKAKNLLSYPKCTHISTADYDKIIQFNPDIVIHLATLSTSRNDAEIIKPMLAANIEFGIQLLSILAECSNLKLFINVGTFAEYRFGVEQINNAYLYSATKTAFRSFVDYYSNMAGFKYITAVPYTIYGDRDNNAKKIMDYIRDSLDAENPIKMTKGEQILDFIHINDVVSFFICTINHLHEIIGKLPNGEEFYVGTGKGTKIRDLAKIFEENTGKTCNIEWGGLAYRPMDIMYAVAPVEKNNELINWKSKISIEEGIKLQLWA
jgi:CDP-paratose synthetase